ncbi:MAG: hypothetical protein AAB267_07290, partial [Candidatus Desantisbacteria bacterium]
NDGEEIHIGFGSTATITTTIGQYAGTFSATFIVNTQAEGMRIITAYGLTSHRIDTDTRFNITGKISWVRPESGQVGDFVTVFGVGYPAAPATITIHFGKTTTITTAPTDINGTFTAVFRIDTQYYGTKVITAIGSLATATYIIVPKIITLLPQSGEVGDEVTVEGTGHHPGEVAIHFGTQETIATATASADGTFSTTFIVNTQKAQTTIITSATDGAFATTIFQIKPTLFIAPELGRVGDEVTIEGIGFGSETVEVALNFQTKTTLANINGTFSVTFILATQSRATIVGTGTGLHTTEFATDNYVILPKIILIYPASQTLGNPVTVVGTGYTAGSEVHIGFGTNPTITTTISQPDGTFSTTFLVDTQTFGTKTITATEAGTNLWYSITDQFQISPRIYAVSPTSGQVGDSVTVFGAGFVKDERVDIHFGTMSSIAWTDAIGTNGTFTAVFTINTQPCGWTTITALGTSSSTIVTNTFKIMAKLSEIQPDRGPVNQDVTLKGTGYSGQQEVVIIHFGTHQTITSVVSSTNGTFSITFTNDIMVDSVVVVTGRGLISGEIATTLFEIKPAITSIQPNSDKVGSIVTVQGAGFGLGKLVWIDFGTKLTITTTISDPVGSTFTVTFLVNTQTGGVKRVTATNEVGKIDATNFTILPNITYLMPTSGTVGTKITVQGTGFATGVVRIDFGTNQTITIAQAGTNGTFSVNFTVNTQVYGSTTITAIDTIVSRFATTTFFIRNKMEIKPTAITRVGEVVSIWGCGYGNTEQVVVSFGTNPTITTTMTDANGTFSTTFITDSQPYGSKVITTRSISNLMNTVALTLEPKILSIIPAFAQVQDVITVIGGGYTGAAVIGIDFGTLKTITTTNTSTNGTFSITFTINTQPGGTLVLTAGDSAGKKATSPYYVAAEIITLTPTQGILGTKVTIMGTGYKGGEVVTISFGTTVTIATTVSSTHGTFSATFITNTQGAGATAVTAKSTSAQYAITSFGVSARITLISPLSGCVGDTVTLKGDGYSVSGVVTIDFGTDMTITTTMASTNGTFSTTFILSFHQRGTWTVTAKTTSLALNTTIFEILPDIASVAPGYYAPVGATVSVTGTGFIDGAIPQFGLGNTIGLGAGNVFVGQNGKFERAFAVNTQSAGTKVLTAYTDDG